MEYHISHILATALVLLTLGGSAGRAQLFRDVSQPFERRAADLVSRMTLDEKISQMQSEAFGIPRLGIHYYNWSSEGLHGIVNDGGYATVFPQAIGMAATWDVNLIHAEADVISTEARAWYYRCLEKGADLLVPEHQHLPRSAMGTRARNLR
jgi:beta-glucosidase